MVLEEKAGDAVNNLFRFVLWCFVCGLGIAASPIRHADAFTIDAEPSQRVCLISTGLGGVPEYEENFAKWADSAEELCEKEMGAEVIRLTGSSHKKTDFQSSFEKVDSLLPETGECWIFLIGHGSYDGRDYKFNIAGPDLLGSDLVQFLNSLEDRTIYAILATSSSGVLIPRLSGPNRVVISATKSEREQMAPLFMSFFLEASRSAEADLDKNGSVSLREAFSLSESAIRKWYEGKKRLQTEHPVLDDSGGQGRLASLAYLSKPPEQSYRSLEARRLLPERVRLEREVEDLKLRKTEMPVAEYYEKLEAVLVELASLNEKIRILEGKE
jgi:hypothetical protein